ncbi:LarC family nickel insertion protein [Mobilicoccus caccae]|uniref:Pyridinium-3,5-bisthiocarboxylic acid mononucleotide nickel insertion protein n=1 Tax=Mobilicoccus caccae TaxID=1859295 RepID=A0ABQ6IJX9_9MICO|nr:LarC family nickel insertion protein [Mobilicoccus caccae]GMA38150.1 UPF0272 protein Cgl2470/cg2715 [Mobilicoccus caccae]
MAGRIAWIDVRAGVAGDMLLGALVDAGADLDVVRRDVEAVLPQTVTLRAEPVTRGVMRAVKLHIDPVRTDQPHRSWRDIRAMIRAADLPERVQADAIATFAALARAEGHVHGVDAEDVHFHEVGAWDSIADVVGVCSALADLDVSTVLTTAIALGDGFVRGAHGVVPVPVPAVLRLLEGSGLEGVGVPARVPGWGSPDAPHDHEGPDAGGSGNAPEARGAVGELATPTGAALLVALATPAPVMPRGRVEKVGIGAGTKDGLPWANVVRIVLLDAEAQVGARPDSPSRQPVSAGASDERSDVLTVLDSNVDDLDPRVWPSVLESLLGAGALDAWLTPVVMKKGRPAHVVSALVGPAALDAVRDTLFRSTTTLGVREYPVQRTAIARTWRAVTVTLGETTGEVAVKIGHTGGEIVTATPEFEDVASLAATAGVPVRHALSAAATAAHDAGLKPGGALPG